MSHPPPPSTASAGTGGGDMCRNCHSDDHWLLHNIKHRGEFKRVCTSCVLKLHPASFCPTCFSLHDPNSLNPIPSSLSSSSKTLTCFKCSSLSHATCVPSSVPKSPYLCPPCSNPNLKFFHLKKSKLPEGESKVPEGQSKVPEGGEDQSKVLDERGARVLLAAAKVAAISMNRAAAVARENAERRVRDAALAKKRAKEAIDHVMALSSKFGGNRRRETPTTGEIQAPVPISAKSPNGQPVKIEKNNGNQMKVEHS